MSQYLSRALAVAVAGATVPAVAWAQTATTVTGRVTTADGGAPVVAASVFIPTLNIGATTREDGTFTFTVPGARATGQTVTLTVRRVGYRTASAPIALTGGTVRQNFTLTGTAVQLGAVVVQGAGLTTTAARLGAVRSQVDSSTLTRASEPNVVQALAAKAPGIIVNQQSGDPGASSKILIRGLNTIQGSGQPLFVVDGTPINNQTISTASTTAGTVSTNRAYDINPDDIANVEVLKSAAAAAIYGARASQGVILITTKRGRAGQAHYSLRTTATVDNVNRSVPLQQLYGQGSGSVTPKCTVLNCRLTGSSFGALIPAGTPIYNHSQDMFDTGTLLEGVLQASGGNERTTFFLSAGTSNQNGIIVGTNDYFRRQSFRVNATQQVLRGLTVTGNLNYVDSRGSFIQRGSNVSGITLGGWRTPATFDNRNYLDSTYGLHRSYRFPNPGPNSGTSSRIYDNPFFVIYNQQNSSNVGRFLGNANLTYVPTDWLTVSYQLGGDYTNDERLAAIPKTSSDQPTGRVRRANYVTYIVDNLFNAQATKNWSESVQTRFAIGTEFNSQRFRQIQIRGNDLIANVPLTLNNTVTQVPEFGGDYTSLVRRESYFGQIQQQLFNDLFITGTIRNDGFSTFGQSSRRNWFPSGQLSYVFTNLYNAGGALQDGKLRVAYGQTGSEPGVYLTNGYFTGGFFGVGGYGDQLLAVQNGQGGLVTASRLGQPNLRPERQNEIEGGFDLGLFRNRADVSFTLYNRVARDVIFDTPLPASSGYAVQARNAAKIQNRGVELSFNIRPYMSRDVDVTFGFQYARNKNRVLALQGTSAVDLPTGGYFTGTLVSAVAPDSTTGESYSLGVFRSNGFARCGITEALPGEPDFATSCAGKARGTLYIGADGFPLQDPTLRVVGDPTPAWTGGFRPSLRVKGLNVTALLDVRRGGVTWNGTKGALYNFGTHADTRDRADCSGDECVGNMHVFGQDFTPGRALSDAKPFAVTGPGAGKAVPIGENWFAGLGSGFGPVSQQFMEDAGFVKLREISVAYTFAQAAIRRIGFSTIDARVAGRNLALWTNYTGVDPETNLGGAGVGARGIDYFNNPLTRSVVFTLSFNR